MAITFDEVSLAAEEIKEIGDKPTIEKIRTQLGSRGSNSTIAKHLHTWRKQSSASQYDTEKVEAPNVVQAAVESAWHRLREQADSEVEKIREESRQQIESVQKQAVEALEERHKLNQEYIQLQESYNAVSAEREILTIDLRKLREEHNILQERYNGLDSRYTDMQGMARHQLNMVTDAHQKEISGLEQITEQLNSAHQKLVGEIKEQSEAERHRQIMVTEGLKVENQKLNKRIDELQGKLQTEGRKIADLEAQLKITINERNNVMKSLTEHEAKWQLFKDKVFVSDELIRKLNGMPELEKSISQPDKHIIEKVESRFVRLSDEIKQLAKQMESLDE